MGAGKTTVGRLLADAMSLRFVDLDRRIERAAGASVAELFERAGEAGFRGLEREALETTAEETDVVVATGGGIMVSAVNCELMARSGTTVWLNPAFATIAERLAADPAGRRPLFGDRASAEKLYASRLPDYGRAEIQVDVGEGENAAVVATRLATLLRGERCAT